MTIREYLSSLYNVDKVVKVDVEPEIQDVIYWIKKYNKINERRALSEGKSYYFKILEYFSYNSNYIVGKTISEHTFLLNSHHLSQKEVYLY